MKSFLPLGDDIVEIEPLQFLVTGVGLDQGDLIVREFDDIEAGLHVTSIFDGYLRSLRPNNGDRRHRKKSETIRCNRESDLAQKQTCTRCTEAFTGNFLPAHGTPRPRHGLVIAKPEEYLAPVERNGFAARNDDVVENHAVFCVGQPSRVTDKPFFVKMSQTIHLPPLRQ